VLARHDIGNVTGPLRVLRLQQARDAARGRLLTLGAGLFAAGALIFTARNSLFAQRTAQATQRTVQLTEQGQVTDRYTKAIEQLGSDKLDVRIGGIYALERIMVGSARDHATIVEVIAAFIRERAPADPASWEGAKPPTLKQPDSPIPPADIRAAVSVIGRRPAGRIERGGINLQFSDLRGIDLYQSNLAGARMPAADLRQALLVDVDLSASFINHANFDGAVLGQTSFRDAYLEGTSFRNAGMRQAEEFTYIGLPTTGPITVRGCDLRKANLQNADFTNAQLQGAQLTGADLQDARVDGADFTEAVLDNTVLKGVDLRSTRGLTRAQIDAAITDETTKLPVLPDTEPGGRQES
jgi:Pentapeptide repeats (8 copies)